jgi:S-adenosylmethionine uptake transporter
MNAIWMLVACFLFATMGACVKLAGGHFNLGQTVFIRGFVSILFISAWVIWFRLSLRSEHWRTHLYRSVMGSLGMLLYFATIARLPLAAAVTLNNTSALFMAAAVIWQQRRRPPMLVLFALLMGFIGVALVLRPTITEEQWLGGVMGLLSGFLGCIAQMNVRALSRAGEPEWRTVFYFSLACSLLAIPVSLYLPTNHASGEANPGQIAFLLIIGLAGGAGQLALTRAYGIGRTIVTASLSYTTVIFSSLYGILLWHDHLSLLSWLGIAIIILSTMISTHPGVWARYAAVHGNED